MRLPNGYGSIIKLGGNRRRPYAVRISVGYELNTAKKTVKQKYRYIGYYTTYKDALKALTIYNDANPDGTAIEITLAELYDKWSAEHYQTVAPRSVEVYSRVWKIFEPIQDTLITDLSLKYLQQFFDISGKNRPTLRFMRILISMMFEYAIRHELMPATMKEIPSLIDISKAGNPNKIVRQVFTETEIEALWKNADKPAAQVYLILIYSGLRIGELLDLKKADINIKDRCIYITHAKTAAGIRKVPIAKKILPLVENFYNTQGDYLLSILSPDGIMKLEYPRCKFRCITDLAPILTYKHRIHDTRHTFISIMADKQIDERIIKTIVGHKGEGVTQTVYTHLNFQILLDAVDAL